MAVDGISAIDLKMEEMRRKNLELLKRHQEIEEDRQLAEQPYVSTESIRSIATEKRTMRSTNKHRTKILPTNHQSSQENQQDRHQRVSAVRRKLIGDPKDNQCQNVQKIDYHSIKSDRYQENLQGQLKSNQQTSIKSELLDYTYPSEDRINDDYDIDEPICAKRRVIVNHQANRIGSGRFNQHQQQQQSKPKSQEQERLRTERMHRFGVQNHGISDEKPEFHTEIPPLSMWRNHSIGPSPMPVTQLHLLPSNMNGHPTSNDHMIGDSNEQMEQSNFIPNFIFPSPINSSPYNNVGPVFFAQATPLISTTAPPSQGQHMLQPQYPSYHTSRTFENSARSSFQHPSSFQTPNMFQNSGQIIPSITSIQYLTSPPNGVSTQTKTDELTADLESQFRFRRPKGHDYDNRFARTRPVSGDFDRLANNQNLSSSSNVNLRFNHDHRIQSRPQSFYGFSSKGSSFNNFSRPSNNHHRYQRNNNNSGNTTLPLSAYMNTDDTTYQNDTNNYQQSNPSHLRRRMFNQRVSQQERHKFPLSCYDPRQYGFISNNQKRNEINQNITGDVKDLKESDDSDLIEEWWEDDEKYVSEQGQTSTNNDFRSKAVSTTTTTTTSSATVNDSGNSSLSTSIHLKESTIDDEGNHLSPSDLTSQTFNHSTTDGNIIESLDKLQQELKLEESLEKHLNSSDEISDEIINTDLFTSSKESGTFDTAHFMQWAKEKFREELAGRLTAQQIQQHDAVITDDEDDDENVEDLVLSVPIEAQFHISSKYIDDEHAENIDDLKDNLQYKLNIDELVPTTKEDSVFAE